MIKSKPFAAMERPPPLRRGGGGGGVSRKIIGLLGLIAAYMCVTAVQQLNLQSILDSIISSNARRALHESLCVQGSMNQRLHTTYTRRLLGCQVETVLETDNFTQAFGVAGSTTDAYDVPDYDAEQPSGSTVAFVVTISSCATSPPSAAFYDAAAVLRNSVCNCTSSNENSGSTIEHTLYAIVHPDAVVCSGSTSDGELYYFDQVKILQELGYWVKLYGPPPGTTTTTSSSSSSSERRLNAGNNDYLMHTYVYNMTRHSVAVMMDFDTIFMEPVDDIVNGLLSSNLKSYYVMDGDNKVNTGTIFLKPEVATFESILDTYNSPSYTGGANTKDLLTAHFSTADAASHEEHNAITNKVLNFQYNDACLKPWNCHYDDTWSSAVQEECRVYNDGWYSYRKDFEDNRWSAGATALDTNNCYHADYFHCYCDGEGGYQSGTTTDGNTGDEDSAEPITYACPTAGGSSNQLVLDPSKNITLTSTTQTGHVCILTKMTATAAATSNTASPMMRSFDGHDWELTAGDYSSSLDQPTCAGDDCLVGVLPALQDNTTESYVLTSYYHTGFGTDATSKQKAAAARFLEQTTFGPTRETITALSNSNLDYQSWIENELSKDIASHREYYRRRLNGRLEYSFYATAASPYSPCDTSSRWRTFALSDRDGIRATATNRPKYVSVKQVAAGYVWMVEGMVRTVTSTLPDVKDQHGNVLEPMEVEPTMYMIEYSGQYKANCIGCIIKSTKKKPNVNNKVVYLDNPKVDLTGIDTDPTLVPTTNVLDISDMSLLVSTNNGYEFTTGQYWSEFNRPDDEFLLNQDVTSLQCADLPNVRTAAHTTPSQLDTAITSKITDTQHTQNVFPPVFGKVYNTATTQFDYFLFSPVASVGDNTVEDPWIDGGGQTVTESDGIAFCSNVPRSPFNQQGCRLSREPTACSALATKVSIQADSTDPNPTGAGVVVCGAVGEVGSDISNDVTNSFDIRFERAHDDIPNNDLDINIHHENVYRSYRSTIWSNHALYGDDQLRQRVAFALYQIIPIGQPEDGDAHAEAWLQYYDVFVRNAFGNYRDVLKEISFNELMSRFLSFVNNQSLQRSINRGAENFPDENYAREIMQLFSVGLFQLNMDGSLVLDSQTGKPIPTYNSDDIMSFARAWTGFTYSKLRGNQEAWGKWGPFGDTLVLNRDNRDWFPKSNLLGGYIGDRYPLCRDLPAKHFLKKGAVYRLLGSRSSPELQRYDEEWEGNATKLELTLDNSGASALYAALCAAPSSGAACTYPGYVTLDQNLAPETVGVEQSVDTIRTVKVPDGVSAPNGLDIPIYYEYVRPACVESTFLDTNTAKKVNAGRIFSNNIMHNTMCADPGTEVATPICCDPGWETDPTPPHQLTGPSVGSYPNGSCEYHAERRTFDSASLQCNAVGQEQCHPRRLYYESDCATYRDFSRSMVGNFFHWTTAGCMTRAKISYETGQIARVDHPDPDVAGQRNRVTIVDDATMNYFNVAWQNTNNNAKPSGLPYNNATCNAIATCYAHTDGCICDTQITDSAVFTDATTDITSKADILNRLHIGAFSPTDVLSDTMVVMECGITDVVVYKPTAATATTCSNLSSDTIFTVVDDHTGMTHHLKNLQSTVQILNIIIGAGADDDDASFRNPVQFISLVEPDLRDMYYETDAVIDHLFHHPSHPPFLALRMLQRFGVSNPSPGYIERVATAYKEGTVNNIIGSGNYGDLSAMVAAILMDRETRSVSLDADPFHGQLREPLLKLTSFFRSMGAQYEIADSAQKFQLLEIGQDVYRSPSVFSFFLPEFQPSGKIGESGLVGPEAMVLTGSTITRLLDGMLSTTKFGITRCHNGWGFGYGRSGCPNVSGDTSLSEGKLNYAPPSTASIDDILDDLSLVLTANRLSANNRAIIKSVVGDYFEWGDVPKAVLVAQQLVCMTPEFHTWGAVHDKSVYEQEIVGYTEQSTHTYKAVVYVFLNGGMDSFNLLVPNDNNCVGGKDMYQEYANIRGVVAIPQNDLLPIDATSSNQVCNTFGVHPDLPFVHSLYNSNDAIFFANTGMLNEPLTKNDDWENGMLFAHNHMTRENWLNDPFIAHKGSGVGGRIMDLLRKNGYQTAATTVDGQNTFNKGVPQYSNPAWTVSTRNFELFDYKSSVGATDMLNLIQELNGYSEVDNNIFSDTWTSTVSQALFEYESAKEIDEAISSNSAYNMDHYNDNTPLGSEFKAVAQNMIMRDLRKVDRDMYYVEQGGYDMHREDELDINFSELNGALSDFVTELQRQGIWDDTAIVISSDFGRTLTPNSDGGTDHAWGGNYLLLGGGVKGGRILGTYPEELTDASDLWVRRGRLIPTLPWDAVWSGIANWMGVKGDVDLDFIVPNRRSFDKCSVLFTDEDLFDTFSVPHDATCAVEDGDGDGVPDASDSCPDTEYWTGAAVDALGCAAASPTDAPTDAAVTPAPGPMAVASVLDVDSHIFNLGGTLNNNHPPEDLVEGVINQWYLVLQQNAGPPGIQVTPDHGRPSIVKGIRLYAASCCWNRVPGSYKIQGRNTRADAWTTEHETNFCDQDQYPMCKWGSFNTLNTVIHSNATSPDTSLEYVEILFPSNTLAFTTYRVTFPTFADNTYYVDRIGSSLPNMILGALELPGEIVY